MHGSAHALWVVRLTFKDDLCAGSVAKAALKTTKGSGSTGVSLTTSPSLEHLQTRSESIDSLASLHSMHETDTLMPRRPATLPH